MDENRRCLWGGGLGGGDEDETDDTRWFFFTRTEVGFGLRLQTMSESRTTRETDRHVAIYIIMMREPGLLWRNNVLREHGWGYMFAVTGAPCSLNAHTMLKERQGKYTGYLLPWFSSRTVPKSSFSADCTRGWISYRWELSILCWFRTVIIYNVSVFRNKISLRSS